MKEIIITGLLLVGIFFVGIVTDMNSVEFLVFAIFSSVGFFGLWWVIEQSKIKAEEKLAEQKAAEEAIKRKEKSKKRKKAGEKRKIELIKKYGEKDGMLIFNKKITEKDYLKKKVLQNKYGEKFGKAVFENRILLGMSKEMVIKSIGNAQTINDEIWYFGQPFDRCIIMKANKVEEDKDISEGLWLDMTKDLLISSYGKPEDEKKEVSKSGTKLKWYYGGRTTRQRTTAYSLEVRLENDLVVGWRELE